MSLPSPLSASTAAPALELTAQAVGGLAHRVGVGVGVDLADHPAAARRRRRRLGEPGHLGLEPAALQLGLLAAQPLDPRPSSFSTCSGSACGLDCTTAAARFSVSAWPLSQRIASCAASASIRRTPLAIALVAHDHERADVPGARDVRAAAQLAAKRDPDSRRPRR